MAITPIPQITPHGHGRFTRFDREKCPHCGRKNDGCIIFESGWIICLRTKGVKPSDKGLGG
jgi:hypothetical protein